jgi:hypothetical protein
LPSSGRCFQVSEELTPPYETPDAAYFFIFVHNFGRGEVNWILTWVLPAILVWLLAEAEEPHVFVVVDHRNALLGPNNTWIVRKQQVVTKI